MALRMNDTLEELRPVNGFGNGITNEDAVDSIPGPVKTADDTSPSGKIQPATATIPYYKLFRYVQNRGFLRRFDQPHEQIVYMQLRGQAGRRFDDTWPLRSSGQRYEPRMSSSNCALTNGCSLCIMLRGGGNLDTGQHSVAAASVTLTTDWCRRYFTYVFCHLWRCHQCLGRFTHHCRACTPSGQGEQAANEHSTQSDLYISHDSHVKLQLLCARRSAYTSSTWLLLHSWHHMGRLGCGCGQVHLTQLCLLLHIKACILVLSGGP